MARHVFPSALDWLNKKINDLESEYSKELAELFRSFISTGIDNDTVQDCFQSEMDSDGFFYDLESDKVEEANPFNWSIDDCQWFIEFRLGIDLNTVEPEFVDGTDRLSCWRNFTAARIDDYET